MTNPRPEFREDYKPGDLAFIRGDRQRFSCVVLDECSQQEWEAYERSSHPKSTGTIPMGAAVIVLSEPEESTETDLIQVRVTDGRSAGWVNVYVLKDPDGEEVPQG